MTLQVEAFAFLVCYVIFMDAYALLLCHNARGYSVDSYTRDTAWLPLLSFHVYNVDCYNAPKPMECNSSTITVEHCIPL